MGRDGCVVHNGKRLPNHAKAEKKANSHELPLLQYVHAVLSTHGFIGHDNRHFYYGYKPSVSTYVYRIVRKLPLRTKGVKVFVKTPPFSCRLKTETPCNC